MLFVVALVVFSVVRSDKALAQPAAVGGANNQIGTQQPATVSTTDRWIDKDPEVTAIGKAAARSREVLNWALSIKDAGFIKVRDTTTGKDVVPIESMWRVVFGFVTVFYFGILVVMAFGLMFHTDWAERSRRALPALIVSIVLSALSFTIGLGIIRLTDRVEQQFYQIHHSGDSSLSAGQKHLRAEELLTVSFNYQDFIGYRRSDPIYNEAVKNHLTIVKLTTWTNYVIAFLIVLRIVILWGLMIFSPFFFPFFVFALTKRVAIVWGREYFRWLLYGPLFALFLTAVPYIWQKTNLDVSQVYPNKVAQESGVPIDVNTDILRGGQSTPTLGNVYESGTNILLSPPKNKNIGLQLTNEIKSGNNLTETDTYSRYLVALIMIWAAILLPFLLLRIIMGLSIEAGSNLTEIFKKSSAGQYLQQRYGQPPQPTGPKPGGPTSVSVRDIPMSKLPATVAQGQAGAAKQATVRSEIAGRFSIPALLSIAGMKQTVPEVMKLMKTDEKTLVNLTEIEQTPQKMQAGNEILDKIANPQTAANKTEVERFRAIKQGISSRAVIGDREAKTIGNAINRNIAGYISSNINHQIAQSALQAFSKNVKNLERTDEPHVATFQRAFKTNTTNIKDMLTKKSTAGDQNSKLALKAYDKLGAISQLSEIPISQMTEGILKDGVKVATALKNPELASTPDEKREFKSLHDLMDEGKKNGYTDVEALEKNAESVIAGQKAQDLAEKSPELATQYSMAGLQSAVQNDQDFQHSKALWKKFYQQGSVPMSASVKDRASWIKQEAAQIQRILDNFLSSDTKRRQTALKDSEQILPFLLMGDYPAIDIAKYLLAKLQAAKEALTEPSGQKAKQEEELVEIPAKKQEKVELKEMAIEEEQPPVGDIVDKLKINRGISLGSEPNQTQNIPTIQQSKSSDTKPQENKDDLVEEPVQKPQENNKMAGGDDSTRLPGETPPPFDSTSLDDTRDKQGKQPLQK